MTEKNWQVKCAELKQRGAYLFKYKLWSDIAFRFNDADKEVIIKAHKLIMAMASPVFAKMFFGKTVFENVNPITLLDVRPEIFEVLLEYIYSDNLDIPSPRDACDLYYAAKKWRLPYIMKECYGYLLTNMSPENVCNIYEIACRNHQQVLVDACVQVFKKRTKEVLKHSSFCHAELETVETIFKLDMLNIDSELDLYKACVKYAISHTSRDSDSDSVLTRAQSKDETAAKDLSSDDEGKENRQDDSNSALAEHLKAKEEVADQKENDVNFREHTVKSKYRHIVCLIKFLTLSPQEFADCQTLSALLTEADMLALSMNISSRETPVAMPDGFDCSMVPRAQSMAEEISRPAATFRSTIHNARTLKKYESIPFYVRHLAWSLMVIHHSHRQNVVVFGVTCFYENGPPEWIKNVRIRLKLVTHKTVPRKLLRLRLVETPDEENVEYGAWVSQMEWSDLWNPEYGFVDDNTITYKVTVNTASRPGSSPDPVAVNEDLPTGQVPDLPPRPSTHRDLPLDHPYVRLPASSQPGRASLPASLPSRDKVDGISSKINTSNQERPRTEKNATSEPPIAFKRHLHSSSGVPAKRMAVGNTGLSAIAPPVTSKDETRVQSSKTATEASLQTSVTSTRVQTPESSTETSPPPTSNRKAGAETPISALKTFVERPISATDERRTSLQAPVPLSTPTTRVAQETVPTARLALECVQSATPKTTVAQSPTPKTTVAQSPIPTPTAAQKSVQSPIATTKAGQESSRSPVPTATLAPECVQSAIPTTTVAQSPIPKTTVAQSPIPTPTAAQKSVQSPIATTKAGQESSRSHVPIATLTPKRVQSPVPSARLTQAPVNSANPTTTVGRSPIPTPPAVPKSVLTPIPTLSTTRAVQGSVQSPALRVRSAQELLQQPTPTTRIAQPPIPTFPTTRAGQGSVQSPALRVRSAEELLQPPTPTTRVAQPPITTLSKTRAVLGCLQSPALRVRSAEELFQPPTPTTRVAQPPIPTFPTTRAVLGSLQSPALRVRSAEELLQLPTPTTRVAQPPIPTFPTTRTVQQSVQSLVATAMLGPERGQSAIPMTRVAQSFVRAPVLDTRTVRAPIHSPVSIPRVTQATMQSNTSTNTAGLGPYVIFKMNELKYSLNSYPPVLRKHVIKLLEKMQDPSRPTTPLTSAERSLLEFLKDCSTASQQPLTLGQAAAYRTRIQSEQFQNNNPRSLMAGTSRQMPPPSTATSLNTSKSNASLRPSMPPCRFPVTHKNMTTPVTNPSTTLQSASASLRTSISAPMQSGKTPLPSRMTSVRTAMPSAASSDSAAKPTSDKVATRQTSSSSLTSIKAPVAAPVTRVKSPVSTETNIKMPCSKTTATVCPTIPASVEIPSEKTPLSNTMTSPSLPTTMTGTGVMTKLPVTSQMSANILNVVTQVSTTSADNTVTTASMVTPITATISSLTTMSTSTKVSSDLIPMPSKMTTDATLALAKTESLTPISALMCGSTTNKNTTRPSNIVAEECKTQTIQSDQSKEKTIVLTAETSSIDLEATVSSDKPIPSKAIGETAAAFQVAPDVTDSLQPTGNPETESPTNEPNCSNISDSLASAQTISPLSCSDMAPTPSTQLPLNQSRGTKNDYEDLFDDDHASITQLESDTDNFENSSPTDTVLSPRTPTTPASPGNPTSPPCILTPSWHIPISPCPSSSSTSPMYKPWSPLHERSPDGSTSPMYYSPASPSYNPRSPHRSESPAYQMTRPSGPKLPVYIPSSPNDCPTSSRSKPESPTHQPTLPSSECDPMIPSCQTGLTLPTTTHSESPKPLMSVLTELSVRQEPHDQSKLSLSVSQPTKLVDSPSKTPLTSPLSTQIQQPTSPLMSALTGLLEQDRNDMQPSLDTSQPTISGLKGDPLTKTPLTSPSSTKLQQPTSPLLSIVTEVLGHDCGDRSEHCLSVSDNRVPCVVKGLNDEFLEANTLTVQTAEDSCLIRNCPEPADHCSSPEEVFSDAHNDHKDEPLYVTRFSDMCFADEKQSLEWLEMIAFFEMTEPKEPEVCTIEEPQEISDCSTGPATIIEPIPENQNTDKENQTADCNNISFSVCEEESKTQNLDDVDKSRKNPEAKEMIASLEKTGVAYGLDSSPSDETQDNGEINRIVAELDTEMNWNNLTNWDVNSEQQTTSDLDTEIDSATQKSSKEIATEAATEPSLLSKLVALNDSGTELSPEETQTVKSLTPTLIKNEDKNDLPVSEILPRKRKASNLPIETSDKNCESPSHVKAKHPKSLRKIVIETVNGLDFSSNLESDNKCPNINNGQDVDMGHDKRQAESASVDVNMESGQSVRAEIEPLALSAFAFASVKALLVEGKFMASQEEDVEI